jgi:hypothetical protein
MAISLSGSLEITGSIFASGGITGSFSGTATSASYATNADLLDNRDSTTFANTGSNAFAGSQNINGNVAITGSLTTTGTITAQTLNVQQVTSSIIYSSGSNVFGNLLSNTQVMTGSVSITGSLSVNGTSSVVGSGTSGTLPKFTGSTAIGNSLFSDNGTNGGFGGANYLNGTDLRSFNISAPLYAGLGFWANNVSVADIFGYGVTGNLIITADPGNVFASSNLIFNVDGTERMRITSGGDLQLASGVATFNRSGKKIELNANSSNANIDAEIEITSGMNLFFKLGGSERMRITSGGDVGIGTSSPSAILHISNANPQLYLQYTGTSGGFNTAVNFLDKNGVINASIGNALENDGVGVAAASLLLKTATGGTLSERMRITSGGNVGIGTTSPLGPLEVRAANRLVSADGILQVNTTNSQAIDLGGSISFGGMWQNSGTTPTEWAQITGRKENSTDSNYAGYLAFATRPMGGVNTERMRITSGGNVLIGTTSDIGEKLRLNGRIGILGATVASGNSRSFMVRGSQDVADDATLSLNITNTSLVFIAENNTGTGALFFCGYHSATITKISDPSDIFSTADTDGKLCIFKSAATDVATVRNRLGSTKNITVSYIGVSD